MQDHIAQGGPVEDGRMVFSVNDLPPAEDSRWGEYRKKVTTRAIKIDGPFKVMTSEGPLTCDDGYLAVDARGYPYPIATEEFNLIYEGVE